MTQHTGLEIAIIGMAGRFPGAADLEAFWRNLAGGVESISFFTDEELREAGIAEELLRRADYVRARGVVDGYDEFDADFFDVNPREAELLDPQHRLFLECCWSALEDAGYAGDGGAVGVFAGASRNTYLVKNVYTRPDFLRLVGGLQTRVATDNDFLTTRVSYKLNLTGPSVDVQTACSTSIVALHLACQSLLTGSCDVALAGGASVILPIRSGYFFEEGGILAPDGHCRAFDANARGTVGGSGVGAVVLKRLEDALADGDTVRAVVKGTAINNDGSLKVGFTAPSVEGQAQVVRNALLVAGVEADSIGLVEAHGTGTALGDPIEVAALARAWNTPRRNFCALGSVKTNIGHLDSAAGIAGVIKAVLALERRQIPPSLNFSRPNPKIDFAEGPFYVARELADWPTEPGRPRRAAVSSFGMGGTNSHAVLEEAPELPPSGPSRRWQLVALSARSAAAVDRMAADLAARLGGDEAPQLADACYTLAIGRRLFPHRRAIVCRDAAEAAAALSAGAGAASVDGHDEQRERPVAFLLPGQGAQAPGMGAGLYRDEPVYRAELDRCCELFAPHLGLDLRRLLHAAPGDAEAAAELRQTRLAQPALFAVEVALARLWASWGVEPAALLGHSLGEIVAAHLAGVFTLPDAVAVVAARGRLMQEMPPGAMLSVPLAEDEVRALLPDGVVVAAVNAPRLCVVAGPTPAVDGFASGLESEGIEVRRLDTSHAFHSPLMEAAAEAFREVLAKVELAPPRVPLVSNLDGGWTAPEEAVDREAWCRRLLAPVRFADGAATLLARADLAVLEVGPGRTLSRLVRQQPAAASRTVVPSLPRPGEEKEDQQALLAALGGLWVSGVPVRWDRFWGDERRRRVPLTTYPFERKRHWVEPGTSMALPWEPSTAAAAAGERPARPLDEWFSLPSWKLTMMPRLDLAGDDAEWLVLADGGGLGEAVAARLRAAGRPVTLVAAGAAWSEDDGRFTVDPQESEHFDRLLAALAGDAARLRILHLWALDGAGEEADLARPAATRRNLLAPLALARSLARARLAAGSELAFVTAGLHAVTGGESLRAEAALTVGPFRVLPQELPGLVCRAVDVEPAGAGGWERVAADLLAELASPAEAPGERVAHRNGRRWLEGFEPARLPASAAAPLAPGAVCLITGGVGGIGLAVARRLARQVPGLRLVLTGRAPLPDRAAWPAWLEEHGAADPVSRKLRDLRELEEAGAEVMAVSVDVADREAMAALVAEAEGRFGPLTALVHSAGVPGGGMVHRRSAAEIAAVLAPKVAGLGVLEEVLDLGRLERVVLCSSLAAVVGGLGQVDYCSANAYLDARAHELARRHPATRVVSVGWDAWRDVGMAARALPQGLKALRRGAGGRMVAAPLVERCVVETEDWASYRTRFAADGHWTVAEHTIAGQHLLPGTAYLDMAATVAGDHAGAERVELVDVAFKTPCIVGASQREVAIDVARDGEGWQVTVSSEIAGGSEEHARAAVRAISAPAAAATDLEAVRERCTERVIEVASDGSYRRHGPHWRCLERVHVGEGEWLARIAVPAVFEAEVERHRLHPAILDVATSFPVRLVTEGDYLPLGYDRLRLLAPLPPRLFSHVRLREGGAGAAALRFDVTLADDAGRPLVEIDGFTIRRIDGIGERLAPPAPPAAAEAGGGMGPEDGAEVFARLAAGAGLPHLLVSVDELPAVIAEYRGFDLTQLTAAAERLRPAAAARPSSREEFVAPVGAIERQVAAIFSDLLGIEEVGAQDDFFALGGHSLLGIQLSARLRERFRVELPVDLIFDNPQVGALAAAVEAAIARGVAVEDEAPIVAASCPAGGPGIDELSEDELDAALLDLLGEDGLGDDGLEEASGRP